MKFTHLAAVSNKNVGRYEIIDIIFWLNFETWCLHYEMAIKLATPEKFAPAFYGK
jgi:hypothetical protein